MKINLDEDEHKPDFYLIPMPPSSSQVFIPSMHSVALCSHEELIFLPSQNH